MKQHIIFSILLLMVGSCTVTKRLHQPGFYIEWNKKQRQGPTDDGRNSELVSNQNESRTNEQLLEITANKDVAYNASRNGDNLSIKTEAITDVEYQISYKNSWIETELALPPDTIQKEKKGWKVDHRTYDWMHAATYSLGSLLFGVLSVIFLIMLLSMASSTAGLFFLFCGLFALILGLVALKFTKGENAHFRKYALIGIFLVLLLPIIILIAR